jgi:hypothetical protein
VSRARALFWKPADPRSLRKPADPSFLFFLCFFCPPRAVESVSARARARARPTKRTNAAAVPQSITYVCKKISLSPLKRAQAFSQRIFSFFFPSPIESPPKTQNFLDKKNKGLPFRTYVEVDPKWQSPFSFGDISLKKIYFQFEIREWFSLPVSAVNQSFRWTTSKTWLYLQTFSSPRKKKKIRCHVKSNWQNGKRGLGCFPVLRSVISIRSQCCDNYIVVFDHFAENKRQFPFKPVELFFHKLPNFFVQYWQCFFPIFLANNIHKIIALGPGANTTTSSYIASAVKIYNATSSLLRFKIKIYSSTLKNALAYNSAGVVVENSRDL